MNITQLKNTAKSGELLLDLGLQPVSNRFTPVGDVTEVPSFPLQLRLCLDSGLIHLGKPFPVEELKPRYDWLTCFEPEEHLDVLVEELIKLTTEVYSVFGFKSMLEIPSLSV